MLPSKAMQMSLICTAICGTELNWPDPLPGHSIVELTLVAGVQ